MIPCCQSVCSGHPERPERISNIFACHGDFGLLERCHRVKPREATEEELLLIHTPDHIRKMKGTQKMSSRDLYKFKENFNSIYFNNHSFQCALVSAGSILQVHVHVLKFSGFFFGLYKRVIYCIRSLNFNCQLIIRYYSLFINIFT